MEADMTVATRPNEYEEEESFRPLPCLWQQFGSQFGQLDL